MKLHYRYLSSEQHTLLIFLPIPEMSGGSLLLRSGQNKGLKRKIKRAKETFSIQVKNEWAWLQRPLCIIPFQECETSDCEQWFFYSELRSFKQIFDSAKTIEVFHMQLEMKYP